MERAKLQRENEERLEQQAVRYEERITELHSVIAELNKKIDRTQPSDVIRYDIEWDFGPGGQLYYNLYISSASTEFQKAP